jgi:50S ribosomal protein L16 3-hydroxylase
MPALDPPSLLGGLSPAAFMHRYWQRRALLVRAALPGFRGCIERHRLFALAGRDDVESRLVVREGRRWWVQPGPIARTCFAELPPRDWTLLVHGINLHHAPADRLLRRFAFVPYARLDDLMVSHAAPGGGVGAHFDSYDVFLLQGPGRRRWRVSRQRDLALRRNLPLKLLARFKPNAQATLSAGDMLYLPPHHAHEGIAVDTCTTYSIGFRAPATDELATAFLDWLRDRIQLDGRYSDAGLRVAEYPARIPEGMQRKCARMLARIRWNDREARRFVGCFLTEPKPSVVFRARTRALTPVRFASAAARHGLRLDARTQMLYDADNVYINGEALAWPGRDDAALRRLANERALPPTRIPPAALGLLRRWHHHGYLDFA